MIINELISNSLKHAFPDDRKGTITVRLKQVSPQDAELIIADNGRGFDAVHAEANPDSLGMTIVGALTEQLNGTLAMSVADGTTFTLRFPLRRQEPLP
ncbi:MAG: sensor histidine kinase [Ignavibacteriales bacterium]|nr:sensor histidine kinase [Ignavibacteriales bacterium]